MNKRKPPKMPRRNQLLQALGCGALWFLHCPMSYGTSGALLFQEGTLSSVDDTSLHIQRYSPSSSEDATEFQDHWILETQINHITPQALIQVSATGEPVWVYVQYFTDLNGDGVYEWEIGEDLRPLWDSFNLSQEFISVTNTTEDLQPISQLVLSAQDLFYHGVTKELQRSQWGTSYLDGIPYTQSGSMVFCFTFSDVPLHLGETTEEHESYYVAVDHIGHENPHILGAYTYTDLDFRERYFHSIDYCVKSGLMYGTSIQEFSPQAPMSRAMAMQGLWNLSPLEEQGAVDFSPSLWENRFPDVFATDWYATAYDWADQLELLDHEPLRPKDTITQLELLQYLYRYAQSQGESPLLEVDPLLSESSFQEEEVQTLSWALALGLLTPNEEGHLFPDHGLSRWETAEIFHLFATRGED